LPGFVAFKGLVDSFLACSFIFPLIQPVQNHPFSTSSVLTSCYNPVSSIKIIDFSSF
jgi:hypothetical protein